MTLQDPDLESSSSPITRIETNGPHKYSTPFSRKCLVVFVTSWTTLCACFSSTSLFSASEQIARDLRSTTVAVNLSNSSVILFMGFSPFIWSPIADVFGRKFAYNGCIAVLLALTLGASFAENFTTFAVLRAVSGLQGTFFHVAGQTLIAQYFPPLQRGRATGFFLAGTVLGPPIAPLVSGVMVTYSSWRAVLWLQSAMTGLGLIFSLLVIQYNEDDEGVWKTSSWRKILQIFNPSHIFRMMIYPNVVFSHITCGFLAWAQYSLLSGPHVILAQQYNLTSPLISGLFYLAPAGGMLTGTILGGNYADRTVRKWIDRREGVRLPQDRLRCGFESFFFIVPVCSFIYGWCLDQKVGGIELAAVMAFFILIGLTVCFSGLNPYCAEVMPNSRPQVIAGKYVIQYTCAAAGSALCEPLVRKVGVGIETSIGAILVIIGGILCYLTAEYGIRMQRYVENKGTLHIKSEKSEETESSEGE